MIHHKAIAPHRGGYYSQTASTELHLTAERGLTLFVKVREGKTILMNDEKPVRYGQAQVFASEGPGTYIVLLNKP